jgi:lysozyme
MSARIALFVALALCGSLAANAAYLRGIDVSNYQGHVDWAAVKASGISFAICKATEGTTYLDPTLGANWAGMHANGIVRGAYHFGHPGSSAIDQARYFVHAVTGVGGFHNSSSLQLVLDLETADGQSPAQVWAWVQAFMGEIQSLTGRPGIIYVGYYFWKDSVGNPTNNLNAPLWIAAYTASPLIPPAWSGFTFWQYTDAGSVPGVAGKVDSDYFAGTEQNLQALCIP